MAPRFAVEAHLASLFESDLQESQDQPQPQGDEEPAPTTLRPSLPEDVFDDLTAANRQRHDWIAEAGQQNWTLVVHDYQRIADFEASKTDPDASLMRSAGAGSRPGYQTHYVVAGGKARIIRTVLVAPYEVMENIPMRDLIWHTCFRWKAFPHQVRCKDLSGLSLAEPVHHEQDGAAGGAERVRRLRRPGTQLSQRGGLPESDAQANGVGRAAVRRGQAVAWAASLSVAAAAEGECGGTPDRERAESQAVAQQTRLRTAALARRRPRARCAGAGGRSRVLVTRSPPDLDAGIAQVSLLSGSEPKSFFNGLVSSPEQVVSQSVRMEGRIDPRARNAGVAPATSSAPVLDLLLTSRPAAHR